MAAKKQNNCMVPDCPHPANIRGLCNSHYIGLAKMVKNGKYTWEQLVDGKKCLKAKKKSSGIGMKEWLKDL